MSMSRILQTTVTTEHKAYMPKHDKGKKIKTKARKGTNHKLKLNNLRNNTEEDSCSRKRLVTSDDYGLNI